MLVLGTSPPSTPLLRNSHFRGSNTKPKSLQEMYLADVLICICVGKIAKMVLRAADPSPPLPQLSLSSLDMVGRWVAQSREVQTQKCPGKTTIHMHQSGTGAPICGFPVATALL